MTELWLKFKDEKGEDQRVLVESEKFTIGRHSNNDLSIPNGKLSREHVKIDRFADIFIVSECGSSNGTTLNGTELKDPVALKNGDKLNLGGGVEVELHLVSDNPNAEPPEAGAGAANDGIDGDEAAETGSAVGGYTGTNNAASTADAGSGIPTSIFYIAPIFGVIILIFLGGLVYLASSGDKPKPDNDDFVYSTNHDSDKPSKNRDDPSVNDNKSAKTSGDPPLNSGTANSDATSPPPANVNLSDSAKCEQNGGAFLRRIAQNDPKAFLTGEQAQIINGKIKQISSASAIVENINSARRSSSQIKTLATSKNLKPQFLAVAAIAKLGTSKGDVLQTAQGMADTLERLGTQIGGELGNESVLLIAAYDQGAAGDFMKMRNMLQDLATKSTESSREIRTIWFLHKNGKITDGEYQFALQFLAIGAITQNPKDFGVNVDALVL
jgi:hypothetical protein